MKSEKREKKNEYLLFTCKMWRRYLQRRVRRTFCFAHTPRFSFFSKTERLLILILQPRTSLSKFGGGSVHLFKSLLRFLPASCTSEEGAQDPYALSLGGVQDPYALGPGGVSVAGVTVAVGREG